jgi:hypothetical protein
MPFKFLVFLAGFFVLPTITQAETLQRKFGPSWSCKMISAERVDLYRECRNCEVQGKEFEKLSETFGKCRDKYSLRSSERPEAELSRERRQREIEAEATAKEKEEMARRRKTRNWLDSNVSGFD